MKIKVPEIIVREVDPSLTREMAVVLLENIKGFVSARHVEYLRQLIRYLEPRQCLSPVSTIYTSEGQCLEWFIGPGQQRYCSRRCSSRASGAAYRKRVTQISVPRRRYKKIRKIG